MHTNTHRPESGGGAVTALNVSSDDQLSGGQALQFKLSAPGPEPAQYAPHPHEVILDPTGGFILVPDLGADLVRIFSVNQSTNLLTALDPVTLTAGTGPRHGTFWSPTSPYTANSALYFYLIAELSNTITSFSVSYSSDGAIQLTEIGLTNSFGGGEVPKGTAAAEIAVSVGLGFPSWLSRVICSRTRSRITDFSLPRTGATLHSPFQTSILRTARPRNPILWLSSSRLQTVASRWFSSLRPVEATRASFRSIKLGIRSCLDCK